MNSSCSIHSLLPIHRLRCLKPSAASYLEKVGKVLLQQLDVLKVFPEFFRARYGLTVGDPGCDFVHLASELFPFLGVLKLLALVSRRLQQLLPQSRELLQAGLVGRGRDAEGRKEVESIDVIANA